MPIEFLKRLPGVETCKLKDVIKKGKQLGIRSMVDVCNADVDTLADMFGQK